MEVVCRDTLTGDERALCVSDDAAVQDLVATACALFGRRSAEAADLTLAFAGKKLTDPLRATPMEGGSLVELVRSNARVLRLVGESTKVDELPEWAAHDKEVVLAVIEHTNETYDGYCHNNFSRDWVGEELRGDREVVLKCVSSSRTVKMLKVASSALRDDYEVVMLAVANDGDMLRHASARLRRDRRVVLAAVKKSGDTLWYADKVLQADKEMVLCALKSKYYATFDSVPPELRNDKDVVLAAVSRDTSVIELVCEDLRADPHVGLVAVNRSPEAIEHMPALMNEKEVMLAVVRNDAGAQALLRYASPELQDDKELVLLAVTRCDGSFAYASERLRDDKDVVLAALRGYALREGHSGVTEHISARLLRDVDVFVASGSSSHVGTEFAHFSSDKEAVMAYLASARRGRVLGFVDDNLRADKEVAAAVCASDAYEYDRLPAELKADKDVFLAALRAGAGVGWSPRWERVPAHWKDDADVAVAAAASKKGLVPELLAVVERTRETALAAVRLGGSRLLADMKPEFQTDKEFLLAAVAIDGALALPDPSLQGGLDREVLRAAARSGAYRSGNKAPNFSEAALDDKELVLEMLKRLNVLKYVSERLKADPDVLETVRFRGGIAEGGYCIDYLASIDEVVFPPSTGLQINMMPFLMEPLFCHTRLPENLRAYWTIMVKPQLGLLKGQHGTVCYLSVDERDVAENESHRRPGLHTESPGCLLKDACVGVYDIGSAMYTNTLDWGYSSASLNGGLFVASNVADSCAAWDCAVLGAEEGEPLIKPHGDVEHLRPILEANSKEQRMAANRLYWMTDRTPHESLPLKKACHRQWFRLVTSGVSAWFVDHSTPNPNGVVPDPDVTITLKGDKFDVKNLVLLGTEKSESPE